METGQKLSLIALFEEGADAFDDVLVRERDVLQYRPFPDAWTIHEHVVHVLESDMAGFHRYRRAVAEPGTAVLGYDEEVWTPALAYHAHDLKATIGLLKAERRYAAAHLRSLAGADWSAYSYRHSQFGLVSLEKWLGDYVDHIRIHREYVDRNLRLWAEAADSGRTER